LFIWGIIFAIYLFIVLISTAYDTYISLFKRKDGYDLDDSRASINRLSHLNLLEKSLHVLSSSSDEEEADDEEDTTINVKKNVNISVINIS